MKNFKKLIYLLLLLPTLCYASPPTRVNTYVPNTVISSADVTANEDALFNYLQAGVDTFVDGSIYNADINSTANIQSDKLNLTSVAQNISNTGTFTNTGNATVTGTLTVSSTATVNGVTYATLPPGVIMPYTTTSAPSGWLLCDGSEVSRTTYSGLFAVIGTTYGSTSGTTFTLPDLRGRNIIGYKSTDTSFDTMGETGGQSTVTLTAAQSGLPAHTHTIPARGSSSAGTVARAMEPDVDNANGASTLTTDSTGGTSASSSHSVLDPYIALTYIIKY